MMKEKQNEITGCVIEDWGKIDEDRAKSVLTRPRNRNWTIVWLEFFCFSVSHDKITLLLHQISVRHLTPSVPENKNFAFFILNFTFHQI